MSRPSSSRPFKAWFEKLFVRSRPWSVARTIKRHLPGKHRRPAVVILDFLPTVRKKVNIAEPLGRIDLVEPAVHGELRGRDETGSRRQRFGPCDATIRVKKHLHSVDDAVIRART